MNRLVDRRDFNAVYSRGKAFRSNLVALHALPRGRPEPRFGISVSKKVGKAVQRNLVKRRVREACRLLRNGPAPPYDFVLVAREAAVSADFAELCRTVAQLVERVVKEGAECQSPTRRGGRRR